MKEGAAKELEFSGGETATPQTPSQSAAEAPISSTFHRCPKEFDAEPTQINHPLRTCLKPFSKLFHIQGTRITTPWLLLPLLSGFQGSTQPDKTGQKY